MQPMLVPSCGVFLSYLFTRRDAVLAATFAEGMKNSFNQAENQPFWFLRERLIREAGRKRSVENVEKLVYAVKAWNAMRRGKKLANLYWRQEGGSREDFPPIL